MAAAWLALIVGNTRLHWGFFEQERLVGSWHTPHLGAELANSLMSSGFEAAAWQQVDSLMPPEKAGLPRQPLLPSALWVASVVPEQTALWAGDASAQVVRRSHIPLSNLYATLGIDRAINLLGASSTVGWPVLVIDGGTALTFTAGAFTAGAFAAVAGRANQKAVYGGAILPGMRLQGQALAQNTAALSEAITISQSALAQASESREVTPALPERWATDTAGAIASGLAYGAIAAITDYLSDWWKQFPQGEAVLTGGDALVLHALLQQKTPEMASRVRVDSNLMFWGMQMYRQTLAASSISAEQY